MKRLWLTTAIVACGIGVLRADAAPPATEAPRPEAEPEARSFKKYPHKPPVLSEADYEQIRSGVLNRCQLKAETSSSGAPWYFHYELGKELVKRGDPQRALDAFIDAVNDRTLPHRGARLYGLWFTDYLPYFEIARAHRALGNWDCAANALTFSRRLEEVSPKDPEYDEFRRLMKEVAAKAGREP